MGHGKEVSPYMKAKIRERREGGATINEIMKEFSVSRTTIFRACCFNSKISKVRGCPRTITSPDSRRLLAQARQTPAKSARALGDLVGISCSTRTIQRELKRNSFVRVCVKKVPHVSQATAAKRVSFAREHLPKGAQFWTRVIFSDEKKWNLKGNDGYVSIWKEKTQQYTFETDLCRFPGVMVWGAICSNGASYIYRIKGKLKAVDYQRMLEEEIFGLDLENLPENFIFQQDNTPVHVARSSMDYFKRKEIPLLSWPPYSPDLNIIENLWGILKNKVYEGGKEYRTADELWESICHHFLTISEETIKGLYQSIPARLIRVIELGGKRTSY